MGNRNVPESRVDKSDTSLLDLDVERKMFDQTCEQNKTVLRRTLANRKKQFETYSKAGNKKAAIELMKTMKIVESQVETIERNQRQVDLLVIKVKGAQDAKNMAKMQNSALQAFRTINANFSVENIGKMLDKLGAQVEQIDEKTSMIAEANEDFADNMLKNTGDDGDDSAYEREYEEYMEIQAQKESIAAKMGAEKHTGEGGSANAEMTETQAVLNKIFAT